MDIGGSRMQTQQAHVNAIKKDIDSSNSAMAKARVGISSAGRWALFDPWPPLGGGGGMVVNLLQPSQSSCYTGCSVCGRNRTSNRCVVLIGSLCVVESKQLFVPHCY